MTKKDYELIAKCINDAFYVSVDEYESTDLHNLISNLGNALLSENPQFDYVKFEKMATKHED